MPLREGEPIVHFYDPAKAHEYYMKNRKLKGRKKGTADPNASAAKGLVKAAVKKGMVKRKLSPQEKARKLAAVNSRISSIKKKLSELNAKLKEKQAAERKSDAKKKRGPTAADKHKKAKQDEKYRDKHKQELKTKAKAKAGGSSKKSVGGDRDSVDGLKEQIARTQGALSAANKLKQQISSA